MASALRLTRPDAVTEAFAMARRLAREEGIFGEQYLSTPLFEEE